jgi:hypothetical protein
MKLINFILMIAAATTNGVCTQLQDIQKQYTLYVMIIKMNCISLLKKVE